MGKGGNGKRHVHSAWAHRARGKGKGKGGIHGKGKGHGRRPSYPKNSVARSPHKHSLKRHGKFQGKGDLRHEGGGDQHTDNDYAIAKALQDKFDAEGSEWVRPTRSRTPVGRLRLLHLSDTHDKHDQIEKDFPLQRADILLHTGDLTNNGSKSQLREVNAWFGKIKKRFKHIVVIAGNHDCSRASFCVQSHSPFDIAEVLTNATVLNHEVAQAVFDEFGLRIYGSPWSVHDSGGRPGNGRRGHHFDKIPEGIDVLMTHGPAHHIFDSAGGGHWGSSPDLNKAIMRARPRLHLFGHLHEQRGVWVRDSSGRYVGGVEAKDPRGKTFPTSGPPPADWPCDVVSCNAMGSHPSAKWIDGPARLIFAERGGVDERWRFSIA